MDSNAHEDPQHALEQARIAAELAKQVSLSQDTPGTALVPAGADSAVAVKAQMAHAHIEVSKARTAAMEKISAAREAIKAQQAELDRAAAALEAELVPLQEKLALMQEGIWTMNLYLGRDEQIVTLAQGAPAPASTPIHVRQQVLAMDEESALFPESGGIDFRNVEAFDQWIVSDPAHLQQVLPEARGVVAIMARRSDVDYGDAFANVSFNEQNKHVYWLIRNGENLYRMDTNFETGPRLVPARNEFTSMFVDGLTGEQLQPGSTRWLKAEKAAGARERHFMRVALILQGLIDRTKVFHPLPRQGVSLLAPQDYDDGHVVLIADDENQLTTGRVGFYDWLASLNRQLRPGMRVILNTAHRDWPRRETGRHNYDHHERITPPTAEAPRSGRAYVIKRKGERAGEFVITYPRTREEWLPSEEYRGSEFRVPKSSASCRISVDDRFVIPVDLVDVPTMREYMGARTERTAYLDMFPVLRAAIELKESEAAAEEPFRGMLAAQVAASEGVDLTTARALVDPVIDTWKIGARWFRPLSGDQAQEARAAKAILAERARIAKANASVGGDVEFVERALREHHDALVVARKKDGTYIVLTPQPRAWGKHCVPQDVWVTQHEYTKTGKPRSSTPWVIASPASVSRWIVLHETEAWASWSRAARTIDHLSDPEILEVVERIAQRRYDGMSLMAVSYDEAGGWWSDGRTMEFTAWYHPGPVASTDRPITRPVPSLYALITSVTVSKDRGGRLSLSWGANPRTNNTTAWSTPFNRVLDADKTAELQVPWSDNRGKRLVWTDEGVLERARGDAREQERQRQRGGLLSKLADRLVEDLVRQEEERVVALARGRFLEDFPDEEAWAQEEGRLRDRFASPLRMDKHVDVHAWYAVRHVVWRLVESGRVPWGISVAEAVTALGEPLNPQAGSWATAWSVPTELPAGLPEHIAQMRFPAAPEQAA